MKTKTLFYLVGTALLLLASLQAKAEDPKMDLSGEWKFAVSDSKGPALGIDPAAVRFTDHVKLPSTTDENGLGTPNPKRETHSHLSPERVFEGVALYAREIAVPTDWRGQRLVLFLERTRKTAVWFDGRLLGSNERSTTPHQYDLGTAVEPGTHVLTIAVDNRRAGWPPGNSHMSSEDTQGNWNGIVGRMELSATPLVWVDGVRFVYDPSTGHVRAVFKIGNATGKPSSGTISVSALLNPSGPVSLKAVPLTATEAFVCVDAHGEATVDLDLGKTPAHWDEFDPNLYHATIQLDCNGRRQTVTHDFGLRDFRRDGTRFTVNGKGIFLRGKHDACVFPLTGYAPMDVASWVKVFQTAKQYGINTYRFHTWCPPDAAFEAADQVGIYLQPELPSWGALAAAEKQITIDDPNAVAFGAEKKKAGRVYDPSKPTEAERFLTAEGEAIFDHYGDHPSFCMFSLGNEMFGNRVVMQRMVDTFRAYDGARRLLAQGSNNDFTDPKPGDTDDFFTTVRTSKVTWDHLDNTVRASFAFVDQKDGGSINAELPSTTRNYSKALQGVSLPVIGHETAQYQFYPDYRELAHYTGVMKPGNLEAAKRLLEEKGMLDQAADFFRAAGAFAAILYGEDMESELRTPGFAGFHILDLQDYPGQETALVGPLNAFMESKGLVTPEQWRQSCDRVVLLAEFSDYVVTGGGEFTARVVVANFGANVIDGSVRWKLDDLGAGEFSGLHSPQGERTEAGQIHCQLPGVDHARRVSLSLTCGAMHKEYPLWIYPAKVDTAVPSGVTVCRRIDDKVRAVLAEGGRVILIPERDDVKEWSVGGLFPTEFWSYTMFSKIAVANHKEPGAGTMGLLIDEKHPALAGFPTEFHSNWQWWSAVRHSRPLILDDAPTGYRPIVQTIDNLWRSHRLGTLCEFSVGPGRLLVSAIDLPAIQDRPEGRALWASLLHYAAGPDFHPSVALEASSSLAKRFGVDGAATP